jgi:hypothetical protein
MFELRVVNKAQLPLGDFMAEGGHSPLKRHFVFNVR